jgi:hypothetical protein
LSVQRREYAAPTTRSEYENCRPVPNGMSSLVSSMRVPSTPNCTATEPPRRRDGITHVMWS